MKEWVPVELLERIEQYKQEHKKLVLTDKRNWVNDHVIPILKRYAETEKTEICIDDEIEHVSIKITASSFAMAEDDGIRIALEIADSIFIKPVAREVEIILWFRCWDYI